MKKIIKTLMLLLCLSISFAFQNNSEKSEVVISKYFKIKHFSGNITLSGGCTIHYEIDVNYSLLPPKVNGVTGTITMGANCSGTQTFSMRGQADVSGTKEIVNFEVVDQIFADEASNEELNIKLQEVLNNEDLFGSR